ncbi:MAG: hypothetical protein QOJ41_1092 [Acidobacteriaceae bacterium]|jgi:hypothetical protein|nr:hypothetical protein [Acidobacteriaceae bacterium]
MSQMLARTYRHVPFRARVAVAAALVALCAIGVLCASLNLSWQNSQAVATVEPPAAPFWPPWSSLLPTVHMRTLYPYSVIAGGAESPQELKEAVAVDPVVAQHYLDFDLAKAHRVTLDAPKLVYVSYRIGNKVFWTKHKLALRKGEAMLSDGRNMARTRCGNRISVLPVRPNAPAEPSSSELEGPEFAPIVASPYLVAFSAPMPAGPMQATGGPVASLVPVAPFFPLPGGGGIVGSGQSSTPPPGGGNGGGGGGGGTPPPGGGTGGGGGGTPPPVGVPEPGTAALVLIGLSAAAMRASRQRKAC